MEALTKHRDLVEKQSAESGCQLEEFDLVFSTTTGSPLDPANVRRAFRRVVAAAGMNPMAWTPRELRHSFVSLLSSSGMPIEDIAHLVGHANTRVTELVYRKELRPVLTRGAVAMDVLFPTMKGPRTLVSRLVSKSQADQPDGLDHDDKRRPDQGFERWSLGNVMSRVMWDR